LAQPEEDQGLAAWLRLTLIPGIGRESQRKLLKAFGLPERIFSAGRVAVEAVLGAKAEPFFAAADAKAAQIEAALLWAKQPGNRILTLADADYPQQLLHIPDPPTLLYARGNLAVLSRPALSIVGSRNATPQGLKTARDFAATLARSGWNIVSGLALGIDAAAHQGALEANGTTLAVVGTGVDRLYPARHKALAQQILEHGAILSEFPLGTPAIAENFPRRNRIISGLSQGVLIVEAALGSGSLITARLAGEQGREVFAIPGSIHSPVSRGCHRLIRQGAKLVETAEDILEELGGSQTPGALPPTARPISRPGAQRLPQPIPAPRTEPAALPPEVTPQEAEILQNLGHDPTTLDELALRTGLATEALLALLMDLELAGRIANLPGNRYQRL
jgi:DNA processing protein